MKGRVVRGPSNVKFARWKLTSSLMLRCSYFVSTYISSGFVPQKTHVVFTVYKNSCRGDPVLCFYPWNDRSSLDFEPICGGGLRRYTCTRPGFHIGETRSHDERSLNEKPRELYSSHAGNRNCQYSVTVNSQSKSA